MRGMPVVSMAPSCIRAVTTAHSSRSPRNFGKITPLARRADLVAGPADPLQPAGDAGRALDLDDEIDRAHVDPELEAGRGDERGQPAGLQLLLDLDALLAGDRAVVGADELLAGQLVEALGEALGEPPAVAEDDRAAVAPDELEDPRVDRRPDAGPHVAAGPTPGRRAAPRAAGLAEARTCPRPARRPGARAACARPRRRSSPRGPVPTPPRKRAIVSSGRWVADSPMRCGGGASRLASHERSSRSRDSARCAPRLEPAIAWTSSTITCSTPRSDLARRAGQEQVERLGRRDQDVRRAAGELAPFLGGVSPVRAPTEMLRHRLAEPLGREGDPGQRCAQVALDVVGQRLERRDVQDPDGPGASRVGGGLGSRSPAGRGTTGTRRGSCRCRSGRGSACGGRRRSPPSRRPGRRSAPRSWTGTSRGRPARTARAGRRLGGDHGSRSVARKPHFDQMFTSAGRPGQKGPNGLSGGPVGATARPTWRLECT